MTFRWIGFAIGILIVVATATSVVVALVLPRSAGQRLSLTVNRGVRLVFIMLSRLARPYETKDAILAPTGPVALLVQLLTFLALFVVGYGFMLWPWSGRLSLGLREAGLSLFSIGTAHVAGPSNDTLVGLIAGTAAITIALQIAYLPSIYSAFNRREALVALMESRAGTPAWGPEVLIRHQLVGIVDALPELYDDWEEWAAEVSESHTTYPVLLLFRSPQAWYSWVLSLLAVLDAAALHLALCPTSAPSQARLCLRMGFSAFRRIASSLHWRFDPDPLPESPLDLSFEEFSAAIDLLVAKNFPIERGAEEAWPHFRGWRVNYEALAYRLADRVVAPPAPWSGPRKHLPGAVVPPRRPPHRSPDGSIVPEDHIYPRPSQPVSSAEDA
ncbi:MAG: hypothetical protein E6G01_07865 [Actinobacteria bacterium]|nr:MAG: hypothetical protein E6G01_07865 [Actinomycetota bacterium]